MASKAAVGAGDDESSLLPGEKKILQIQEPVSVFIKGTRARQAGAEEYVFSITNFRLILLERQKGKREGTQVLPF